MDAWWARHNTVALGDYTRDEIENYTGCNPLLLASCTRKEGQAQPYLRRDSSNCTAISAPCITHEEQS